MYDDQGCIVAGVLVMNDATGPRIVEDRLADHARLLENTEDAVIAVDAQFLVTTWNKGAERMYGWTAEEMLGADVTKGVRFRMTDDARAEMRGVTAEQGRTRRELAALRKNGEGVDVEVINVAVRDDQGGVTGYLGIHRDVTERRRFEAERQRLADIVENSSDFIGICDLDWRAIYLNQAGQRLVGLDDPEAIGQTTVLDYFWPEDREFVREEVFPAIMENGRWAGERELRLRHFETGKAIPVLYDAFRIDDPTTGRPVRSPR